MLIGNTPQTTIRTDFVFIANDQQTVFTGTDSNNLVLSFDINNFDIFVNGLLLTRADFSNPTGSAITLGFPRNAGDVVTVRSYGMLTSLNALLPAKIDIANGGYYNGTRNRIINGDFFHWQRNSGSPTFVSPVSNFYSADRWVVSTGGTGGAGSISIQQFAAGQTAVPGNPSQFLRWAITSAPSGQSAGNNYIEQRIEDVRTLSGKTATITFYAEGTGNINVNIIQQFGSGGSALVQTSVATAVALNASWTKYQYVISVPNISGKTIGTSSYLSLNIQVPINATFTLDLAHVSFVEGDASNELDPFGFRHVQQELSLCQRYYERFFAVWIGDGTSGGTYGIWCPFKMWKRASPAVTNVSFGPAGNGGMNNRTVGGIDLTGASIVGTMSAATGSSRGFSDIWQADAEF